MVHKRDLIVVVRVGNQILREDDDVNGEKVVTIPFGSEYNLQIKNLRSQRVVVHAEVDGEAIMKDLVVQPNSTVVVERFFEGNMNSGHRLRFIQKTKEISEHRGDRIDDGILRIEYRFEKVEVVEHRTIIHEDHHYDHHHPWYPKPWDPWRIPWITYSSVTCSSDSVPISWDSSNYVSQPASNESINVSQPATDEGITVKGSQSNQHFTYTSIGGLEEVSYVIVLRLRGINSISQPVVSPVTTRERIECPTCGRKSKSSHQFCSNCSTALR